MQSFPTAAGLVGAIALTLVAAAAVAQQAGDRSPVPAGVSKDPAAAPAGNYRLDPKHTSVIARIGHGNGFSYSTFRFGTTAGTLSWDPAKTEDAKLDVTLETQSIMTPVEGFALELTSDRYLNAAKYPQARFVSTAVRRLGPTKGEIMGDLTFMGQTRPMTIQAELVGAGKNMRGISTIGLTGTAKFRRSDFGFTTMAPAIGDEVQLVIDTEFNQQAVSGK